MNENLTLLTGNALEMLRGILDYIPYGKQNAISRERLAQLSGMGDRWMRKEIERLRSEGQDMMVTAKLYTILLIVQIVSMNLK